MTTKKEAPGTGGTEGRLGGLPMYTREAGLEQVSIDAHDDFIQSISDRLECLEIIERLKADVMQILDCPPPGLQRRITELEGR